MLEEVEKRLLEILKDSIDIDHALRAAELLLTLEGTRTYARTVN